MKSLTDDNGKPDWNRIFLTVVSTAVYVAAICVDPEVACPAMLPWGFVVFILIWDM